jgi:hypothetical protein
MDRPAGEERGNRCVSRLVGAADWIGSGSYVARASAGAGRSIDRRLIGYGAVVRRGASDGESTWGVCSRRWTT